LHGSQSLRATVFGASGGMLFDDKMTSEKNKNMLHVFLEKNILNDSSIIFVVDE
jgi:hypothetical protein